MKEVNERKTIDQDNKILFRQMTRPVTYKIVCKFYYFTHPCKYRNLRF